MSTTGELNSQRPSAAPKTGFAAMSALEARQFLFELRKNDSKNFKTQLAALRVQRNDCDDLVSSLDAVKTPTWKASNRYITISKEVGRDLAGKISSYLAKDAATKISAKNEAVLKRFRTRYTRPSTSCGAVKYTVLRVINVVKAFFGWVFRFAWSDWQKARALIEKQLQTLVDQTRKTIPGKIKISCEMANQVARALLALETGNAGPIVSATLDLLNNPIFAMATGASTPYFCEIRSQLAAHLPENPEALTTTWEKLTLAPDLTTGEGQRQFALTLLQEKSFVKIQSAITKDHPLFNRILTAQGTELELLTAAAEGDFKPLIERFLPLIGLSTEGAEKTGSICVELLKKLTPEQLATWGSRHFNALLAVAELAGQDKPAQQDITSLLSRADFQNALHELVDLLSENKGLHPLLILLGGAEAALKERAQNIPLRGQIGLRIMQYLFSLTKRDIQRAGDDILPNLSKAMISALPRIHPAMNCATEEAITFEIIHAIFLEFAKIDNSFAAIDALRPIAKTLIEDPSEWMKRAKTLLRGTLTSPTQQKNAAEGEVLAASHSEIFDILTIVLRTCQPRVAHHLQMAWPVERVLDQDPAVAAALSNANTSDRTTVDAALEALNQAEKRLVAEQIRINSSRATELTGLCVNNKTSRAEIITDNESDETKMMAALLALRGATEPLPEEIALIKAVKKAERLSKERLTILQRALTYKWHENQLISALASLRNGNAVNQDRELAGALISSNRTLLPAEEQKKVFSNFSENFRKDDVGIKTTLLIALLSSMDTIVIKIKEALNHYPKGSDVQSWSPELPLFLQPYVKLTATHTLSDALAERTRLELALEECALDDHRIALLGTLSEGRSLSPTSVAQLGAQKRAILTRVAAARSDLLKTALQNQHPHGWIIKKLAEIRKTALGQSSEKNRSLAHEAADRAPVDAIVTSETRKKRSQEERGLDAALAEPAVKNALEKMAVDDERAATLVAFGKINSPTCKEKVEERVGLLTSRAMQNRRLILEKALHTQMPLERLTRLLAYLQQESLSTTPTSSADLPADDRALLHVLVHRDAILQDARAAYALTAEPAQAGYAQLLETAAGHRNRIITQALLTKVLTPGQMATMLARFSSETFQRPSAREPIVADQESDLATVILNSETYKKTNSSERTLEALFKEPVVAAALEAVVAAERTEAAAKTTDLLPPMSGDETILEEKYREIAEQSQPTARFSEVLASPEEERLAKRVVRSATYRLVNPNERTLEAAMKEPLDLARALAKCKTADENADFTPPPSADGGNPGPLTSTDRQALLKKLENSRAEILEKALRTHMADAAIKQALAKARTDLLCPKGSPVRPSAEEETLVKALVRTKAYRESEKACEQSLQRRNLLVQFAEEIATELAAVGVRLNELTGEQINSGVTDLKAAELRTILAGVAPQLRSLFETALRNAPALQEILTEKGRDFTTTLPDLFTSIFTALEKISPRVGEEFEGLAIKYLSDEAKSLAAFHLLVQTLPPILPTVLTTLPNFIPLLDFLKKPEAIPAAEWNTLQDSRKELAKSCAEPLSTLGTKISTWVRGQRAQTISDLNPQQIMQLIAHLLPQFGALLKTFAENPAAESTLKRFSPKAAAIAPFLKGFPIDQIPNIDNTLKGQIKGIFGDSIPLNSLISVLVNSVISEIINEIAGSLTNQNKPLSQMSTDDLANFVNSVKTSFARLGTAGLIRIVTTELVKGGARRTVAGVVSAGRTAASAVGTAASTLWGRLAGK